MAKSYKRKYRRRRKYGRRSRSRQLRIHKQPIPLSCVVNMRYVCSFGLDADPGSTLYLGTEVLKVNSIANPQTTGHQPMGHDQWKEWYSRYVVLRCKVTVDFSQNDNSTQPASIVGLHSHDATGAISDGDSVSYAAEQPNTTYGLINDQNKAFKRITRVFDARRFFGCTNPRDRDDLTGTFENNPGNIAYITAFAGPVDGSTNAAQIRCLCTMVYTVLLKEPLPIAQS